MYDFMQNKMLINVNCDNTVTKHIPTCLSVHFHIVSLTLLFLSSCSASFIA